MGRRREKFRSPSQLTPTPLPSVLQTLSPDRVRFYKPRWQQLHRSVPVSTIPRKNRGTVNSLYKTRQSALGFHSDLNVITTLHKDKEKCHRNYFNTFHFTLEITLYLSLALATCNYQYVATCSKVRSGKRNSHARSTRLFVRLSIPSLAHPLFRSTYQRYADRCSIFCFMHSSVRLSVRSIDRSVNQTINQSLI